jgi:hypothetical protein
MNAAKINGLRVFLLTLLELVGTGKKESCSYVEETMESGIASALYSKYKDYFDRNGFNPENLDSVDTYFHQWSGCADGAEMRRYACSQEGGLLLLVALALNEIY